MNKWQYHPSRIRNFSIIAHIDHGKSTLADRFIEITKTVESRKIKEQMLDDMELEREKGITIKAHPVTMYYEAEDGNIYQLNLIDTPGHVDFTYEVSRSLAATEGCILVVDAAQGVQAQSLANLQLALERDLFIIPVLNKIDLPQARPEEVIGELEELLCIEKEGVFFCSAKTGQGCREILEAIIKLVPSPKVEEDNVLKALIFDSHYDSYKGAMAYVRVMSGSIKCQDRIIMMNNQKEYDVTELGVFAPARKSVSTLSAGEVGYCVAGIKDSHDILIGDTITHKNVPAQKALEGFKKQTPVVYAGIYPIDSDDFQELRDAFSKLMLNDSALEIEADNSHALGFGYRCGFLGLLHLEVTFERLAREFDLQIISTAPSVIYRVYLQGGKEIEVDGPTKLPDPSQILRVEEPIAECRILAPKEYLGAVMSLARDKRGIPLTTESIDGRRLLLSYHIPLAELIMDFNDKLKSITRGYGSYDYRVSGYQKEDIVKLEVLINEESVDAFSLLIPRKKAEAEGRLLCKKLKDLIPRAQFKIPIQACCGAKILARETIPALAKNVTAKCYGGDITRKRKLWEKQKEGKKKMRLFGKGKVEVPKETFLGMLKREP